MPTTPSTSLPPLGNAAKRKHGLQLPAMEPPKRPRRGARDSAASSSILPLGDELTLSPSVSAAIQSERWRLTSPARHMRLLEYATPRVRYLYESDYPGDRAAQGLRGVLAADPPDWEPDPNKIQEVLTGSRKCVTQQRSGLSWITEVSRPILQAAIGDLPLESWGVLTETASAYQPLYTARDHCNRNIDWVVGFPEEQWETFYGSAAAKFRSPFINHVDHPHTGTQVLGCGCVIKPPGGNLLEAQVQLGVWTAGFFSWAFQHRSGTQSPPPMIGIISVGDIWGFYIVYAVQQEADDGVNRDVGEVRVWGPLPELGGRCSTQKMSVMLVKNVRRVMEYVCGGYID
ncbi:hypothetical protein N8T08_007176 [Aspergillus melleus]|uniref:Uncharacterized protein n=1 Tax=Aspergillus melleus TaxID=138277 RepID=A0ACC3AY64_9EURO|nr:hypothetical protein N8T08_007176 [Aspergillus melleus]